MIQPVANWTTPITKKPAARNLRCYFVSVKTDSHSLCVQPGQAGRNAYEEIGERKEDDIPSHQAPIQAGSEGFSVVVSVTLALSDKKTRASV